jgi:hypothetical protein
MKNTPKEMYKCFAKKPEIASSPDYRLLAMTEKLWIPTCVRLGYATARRAEMTTKHIKNTPIRGVFLSKNVLFNILYQFIFIFTFFH